MPCRPAWKKSSGESFPSLLLGSPLDAFDRERRGRRNTDNALHCDTCNSRRLGGLIRLYLPSAPSVSVDDDEGPWPFLRQILSVENWTTCCCEMSKWICRTTWILLFSNLFFVLELLYWPIPCPLSKKCTIGKIYIDIYVSIQNSIPLLIQNGNKSSSNL